MSRPSYDVMVNDAISHMPKKDVTPESILAHLVKKFGVADNARSLGYVKKALEKVPPQRSKSPGERKSLAKARSKSPAKKPARSQLSTKAARRPRKSPLKGDIEGFRKELFSQVSDLGVEKKVKYTYIVQKSIVGTTPVLKIENKTGDIYTASGKKAIANVSDGVSEAVLKHLSSDKSSPKKKIIYQKDFHPFVRKLIDEGLSPLHQEEKKRWIVVMSKGHSVFRIFKGMPSGTHSVTTGKTASVKGALHTPTGKNPIGNVDKGFDKGYSLRKIGNVIYLEKEGKKASPKKKKAPKTPPKSSSHSEDPDTPDEVKIVFEKQGKKSPSKDKVPDGPKTLPKMKIAPTYTITFGDQGENHTGMQKIGEMATEGFHLSDLKETKKIFEARGAKCELVHLNDFLDVKVDVKADDAYVLIIRKAADFILSAESKIANGANALFIEQSILRPDTKALMRGKVVNKHARYNLCFDEEEQCSNFEEGKGTIIAYKNVPYLQIIRQSLPKYFGKKSAKMIGEGNYYYDPSKCGIGFHGDGERKKVIALRLGATMNMQYQWFLRSKPIGKRYEFFLEHGDMYMMSEKAVGTDWKSSSKLTLRHAAGCPKFTTIVSSPFKPGVDDKPKKRSKKA